MVKLKIFDLGKFLEAARDLLRLSGQVHGAEKSDYRNLPLVLKVAAKKCLVVHHLFVRLLCGVNAILFFEGHFLIVKNIHQEVAQRDEVVSS